jgi:parvulin-like peptidyl-prolyl isomerase
MKSKSSKTNWIGLVLLMSAMVVSTAYGQDQPVATAPAAPPATESQPGAASRVVLRVGGQEVTQADMDFLISTLNPQEQAALKAQGLAPVGNEYALLMVLSQRAVADHLDKEASIRQRVALERMKLLAQAEYQNLAKHIQISPADVSQYFAAHKDEFDEAEIREILIRKKPAGAAANAAGFSSADAHAKLSTIAKALAAGTDIQQVAKQYDVPNVVMVDTQTQTVRKGQLLPALDKAAFTLQNGQVSDPIETPQAVVAIQVVGHKPPDLTAASQEIENILRQQQLQGELANLKKSANIWMDQSYFGEKPEAPSAGSSATTPTPPKHSTSAPPK